MTLKERAASVNRYIPAIMLALKDRRTGMAAKALALLTICYALSPIDLIPDFIPVLGYLDNLLILPSLAALTLRFIPQEIISEYLEAEAPAKRWYYAIPLLAVYAAVLLLILRAVL